jgi:hypothetical protein
MTVILKTHTDGSRCRTRAHSRQEDSREIDARFVRSVPSPVGDRTRQTRRRVGDAIDPPVRAPNPEPRRIRVDTFRASDRRENSLGKLRIFELVPESKSPSRIDEL